MPTTGRALAVAAAAVVVIAVGVAVVGNATRRDDTASVAVSSTATAGPGAGPGQAATQADLVGIWVLDHGRHLLRFAADGTYAIDADGHLIDGPDDTGAFSVAGNTLTFVTEEPIICEPGDTWVWYAELVRDGHLYGTVLSDDCLAHLPEWTWTRVSPDSQLTDVPTPRPSDAEALPDLGETEGIWLLDGGSMLLAMSPDGEYAWDDRGRLDTEPADSGRAELDGSTLTFSSTARGAVCSANDRLVLDDVVQVPRGTAGLHATVTKSTCADISGAVSFTRLSP